MCRTQGNGYGSADSRTTLAVTSVLLGTPELTLQDRTDVDDDVIALCDDLPTHVLIECIARALACTMEKSEFHVAISQHSEFCSSKNPNISVEHYLGRLHKFFNCSDYALITAVVMLDRFLVRCRSLRKGPQRLTMWNIHRLLLTCLVTVLKFNEDCVHRMNYYAKVGGIDCRELNQLECTLLSVIDYDVHVHPKEYKLYESVLRILSTLPPLPPKQRIKSVTKNIAMQIFKICSPSEGGKSTKDEKSIIHKEL